MRLIGFCLTLVHDIWFTLDISYVGQFPVRFQIESGEWNHCNELFQCSLLPSAPSDRLKSKNLELSRRYLVDETTRIHFGTITIDIFPCAWRSSNSIVSDSWARSVCQQIKKLSSETGKDGQVGTSKISINCNNVSIPSFIASEIDHHDVYSWLFFFMSTHVQVVLKSHSKVCKE